MMITQIVMNGAQTAPAATTTRTASSGAARLGGIASVWNFFIGSALTISSDVPAIQKTRNQTELHQPSPNCSLRPIRPIIDTAPAGAGIPTKYSFAYGGRVPSSAWALYLARRSTTHTMYSSTTIQPTGHFAISVT